MRFEFKPCPDCGDRCNKPMMYRKVYRDSNDDMVSSVVRAVCPMCNWETKGHRNVKECADEWNSTVIYE